MSILLGVGQKFNPIDSTSISSCVNSLLERLTTFLLTKTFFPSYKNEAYRQLSDENVYECINFNPVNYVVALIDGKLKKMVHEGNITEVNRKYLKGESVNLGRFYLLPKIHKRLVNVPSRPVVSNCGTPTERISVFVDYHINPIVKCLPSVLVDTSDFLRRLENVGYIPETAIFGTIDVVGLYHAHIPHDEGLHGQYEENFRRI